MDLKNVLKIISITVSATGIVLSTIIGFKKVKAQEKSKLTEEEKEEIVDAIVNKLADRKKKKKLFRKMSQQ